MTASNAAATAVAVCAIAAVVEGVCAGRTVRAFFETVRLPRYSAPLWVWSCIGAIYYLVFGLLLYRLLSHPPPSRLLTITLTLIGLMMLGNGLTNLAIFRYRDLRLSYLIGNLYALLDLVLVMLVARLDPVAAWVLAPYLVYRIYAVWWGRALATLNPAAGAEPQRPLEP